MSKVAIVYWSGTGNTAAMANLVAEGATGVGAAVDVFTSSEFNVDKVAEYDAIGFGCPSMGSEQLEEFDFEPMYEGVKPALSGKKVALFGSFGWGDGEWMRNWEADCAAAGAKVLTTLTVNGAPDGSEDECKQVGEDLAYG